MARSLLNSNYEKTAFTFCVYNNWIITLTK